MVRAVYAALYNGVLCLLLPWVLWRLWWRGRSEPGYRVAMAERFGSYRKAAARTGAMPAPVIWIHAVSLGETRAAEPLIRALSARYPDHRLLVTQMTATGRAAAIELFGGEVDLAWLPYDYPFAVRRFLAHFRPSIGVIMETELWFNLVRECSRAGVPVVLANARLSEKSAAGYALIAPLAKQALESLASVAAQTAEDAQRLGELGAVRIEVTGNLKFEVPARPESGRLAAQMRQGFGERPVFLAASTRDGEEALILDAMNEADFSNVLTVIVPRHPARFEEVAQLLRARGHAFIRRSEGRSVGPDCRFFLGDSLGEMGAYYRACDVAFVGGSLLAFGGQNLIEACDAGVPVIVGPFTYNFSEAAHSAVEAGAALRVDDAGELLHKAMALLMSREARNVMGEAGRRFCGRHRGASAKIVAILERELNRSRAAG